MGVAIKARDAGSAHPQARELAHPLHMEFLRRNYGFISETQKEAQEFMSNLEKFI